MVVTIKLDFHWTEYIIAIFEDQTQEEISSIGDNSEIWPIKSRQNTTLSAIFLTVISGTDGWSDG